MSRPVADRPYWVMGKKLKSRGVPSGFMSMYGTRRSPVRMVSWIRERKRRAGRDPPALIRSRGLPSPQGEMGYLPADERREPVGAAEQRPFERGILPPGRAPP